MYVRVLFYLLFFYVQHYLICFYFILCMMVADVIFLFYFICDSSKCMHFIFVLHNVMCNMYPLFLFNMR